MKYYLVLIYQKLFSLQVFKNSITFMHKQCSTFKNVLKRYLFFVMYLIFQKIKVMIIFKHLFVISIPSKTLATSSQYVRKLAIFALLIEGRGITMVWSSRWRHWILWTIRMRPKATIIIHHEANSTAHSKMQYILQAPCA